jgi:hypothetical protein
MAMDFPIIVIFILQFYRANRIAKMNYNIPSVTRRKYVHVGSNAAFMLHTVTEGMLQSMFIALD